mgnify:CR=1 FL=1
MCSFESKDFEINRSLTMYSQENFSLFVNLICLTIKLLPSWILESNPLWKLLNLVPTHCGYFFCTFFVPYGNEIALVHHAYAKQFTFSRVLHVFLFVASAHGSSSPWDSNHNLCSACASLFLFVSANLTRIRLGSFICMNPITYYTTKVVYCQLWLVI